MGHCESSEFGRGIALIEGDERDSGGRRHMILHGWEYVFEVVLSRNITRSWYARY